MARGGAFFFHLGGGKMAVTETFGGGGKKAGCVKLMAAATILVVMKQRQSRLTVLSSVCLLLRKLTNSFSYFEAFGTEERTLLYCLVVPVRGRGRFLLHYVSRYFPLQHTLLFRV